MSSTQIDSPPSFATQIPAPNALVPVQPAPQELVVATPPKQRLTFTQVRDFVGAIDFDGTRKEHGGNRTWATFNNGVNAALSAGHCFPVLSAVAAPFSIGWGALKIVGGLIGLVDGADAGVARGLWVSGAKSMALGASVFLMPGVSELVSAVAAAKDATDALNAAVDRPVPKD